MDYIFLAIFTLISLIFIYNSHYRWTYLFAIGLFTFFAGTMLFLSGQWQRGLNFASVLFVVLMLFHRLKIHYYKQPLLISDFWLVIDWRNWETLVHYRGAIFAVLGLIALLGYAIMGWSNAESLSWSWRILGALSAVLSLVLMWHYSKNKDAVQVWLDSLPDDGRDVFLNLPMSCRGVFFKTPEIEANSRYFQQLRKDLSDFPLSSTQPNIVVCLQESTLNPHQFNFDEQDLPPLSMFERQTDTCFNSPLRVHTFGGATWKSEFAFLAGVPSTDFGAMASGVFYSVVPHLRYSFIQNLRQAGYFCVALSPFTKGNYNAKNAYEHLGFDLMLQPQDLGYPAPLGKNLWHISSQEMLDYGQMILDKKHPSLTAINQPLFVYILTMREHGPYNADSPNQFNLKKSNVSERVISCANDYSQRIQALNVAIETFNLHLQQRNQPYILAYFGDHQVAFENYTLPKKWDYAQPDYVTQFIVRTNCADHFQQQQSFLDLAQAGGLLLEIAGLKPDEFMQANIHMRKLSGGKLEDCEDRGLVESYRAYLYQDLKITD